MEIDAMVAGPEMDAYIADILAFPLRPYSTDIKAAWDLVGALIEKLPTDESFSICTNNWSHTGIAEEWSCFFGNGIQGEAKADTAPLAICRGALKYWAD